MVGGQINVNAPVDQLAADISQLIIAGARHFLVLNLPLLGDTPRYNNDLNSRDTYNIRTQQFNVGLSAALTASKQAILRSTYIVSTLPRCSAKRWPIHSHLA